jgi:predicted outer membrane repeat protein
MGVMAVPDPLGSYVSHKNISYLSHKAYEAECYKKSFTPRFYNKFLTKITRISDLHYIYRQILYERDIQSMKKIMLLVVLLLLSIGIVSPARAAVMTDCLFSSLQTAVTTAVSGDTIDYGSLGCTVNFTSTIAITGKTLTFIANPANRTTFDGGGTVQLISTDSSLVIDGINFSNGRSAINGGAVNALGAGNTLSIFNSQFANNNATNNGGAVSHVGSGPAIMNNVSFDGNEAINGEGGAVFAGRGINITDCLFTNNTAFEDGGGISASDDSLVSGCRFIANQSDDGEGGAVQMGSGGMVGSVEYSEFYQNSAVGDGGAVSIGGGGAVGTLTGNIFANNTTGGDGAGAVITGGSAVASVYSNTFAYNTATGNGGGLFIRSGGGVSATTMTNNTFYANVSGMGGAGYHNDLDGILNITHNTFAMNGTGLYDVGIGAVYNIQHNIISDSCVNITADATNLTNIGCSAATNVADLGLAGFDGTVVQLLTGSVAIDYYAPACAVTNDALGTSRPLGAGCDVGAVESAGVSAPITPPSTTSGAAVLGCALDTVDGVEVANAPDNTYCRILMRNGSVISYSGAVPADLIGLGVILAVDVYRLEGGMSINTFPAYARICLSGAGRYFYMDGRDAPRYSVEMPTEQVDGLTCAWIPAPGTVILTN